MVVRCACAPPHILFTHSPFCRTSLDVSQSSSARTTAIRLVGLHSPKLRSASRRLSPCAPVSTPPCFRRRRCRLCELLLVAHSQSLVDTSSSSSSVSSSQISSSRKETSVGGGRGSNRVIDDDRWCGGNGPQTPTKVTAVVPEDGQFARLESLRCFEDVGHRQLLLQWSRIVLFRCVLASLYVSVSVRPSI